MLSFSRTYKMSDVDKLRFWLGIYTVLLTWPQRMSANQGRPLMPLDFLEICYLQHPTERANPIRINCELSSHDTQKWRLDSLRQWISKSGQLYRFSYNITCSKSGGSVSLPWPMKCPRLVELTIRNCNLTDLFSEFGQVSIYSIPPHLTKIEIVDSTINVKESTMLKMISQIQNITSEYDCLHDKTLEKLTFRNVSYAVEHDLKELRKRCTEKFLSQRGDLNIPVVTPISNSQNVSTDESNVIQDPSCDFRYIQHVLHLPEKLRHLAVRCNYEKLRSLDESISCTRSVYHHRFMTKYNRFPVLEIMNNSYNHIDVIPEELRDWTFYFNSLKHMDLSHNNIHTLKFVTKFNYRAPNDTYISVRYNNITTLTPKDLDLLKRQSKTFIDIRNNPIICDCALKDLIVVISNPNTFTGPFKKYEYIRDMTCFRPMELEGRSLKSVRLEDLDCHSNSWVVPVVAAAVLATVVISVVLLALIYRREIRFLYWTYFQRK